jgi:hypothetical protein
VHLARKVDAALEPRFEDGATALRESLECAADGRRIDLAVYAWNPSATTGPEPGF